MKTIHHTADFCVVGGGLSGLCAAIAAARRGLSVVLMHDRPVLGGNASSEIRMWICGAHGENNRETGLIEQIELENFYRNRQANYSLWDGVLYGMALAEKENLRVLYNCTCQEATMEGTRIASIRGYQSTAETFHVVKAAFFADCSGDSILAPLTGAAHRIGREAQATFDESIQPIEADTHTMGMSCLIQMRETPFPQPFVAPDWASRYEGETPFPYRDVTVDSNFWYLELGGDADSIHDTEAIKDDLLRTAFGVVDYLKNRSPKKDLYANWTVEWMGFLPGKRESRRYVGAYTLTQNDVRAGGQFEDIVAYGGWSMDDHHPAGLNHPGEPTIYHAAPSPFGIPYRCLYAKEIENLFFAGRNISVTHAALSATRVMGTCGLLGQAIGTAAALAAKHNTTPAGVYEEHIHALQHALMADDCYLPGLARPISALTKKGRLTASSSGAEALINGHDRPIGGEDNSFTCPVGGFVALEWATPETVRRLRIVADSDLNRKLHNMPCCYPLSLTEKGVAPPETLLKSFAVDVLENGAWRTIQTHENCHQRLIWVDIGQTVQGVRIRPLATWGSPAARLFAFEAE